MKKTVAFLLILAIMLPLVACSSIGSNETASSTEPTVKDTDVLDKEALTTELERLRTENKIVGMVVAVTDGEATIYQQSFGVDDMDVPDVPANPHAIYRIGSLSKTFTAFLALRLCEAGILDLDTPIKAYVPDLTLSIPNATESITLRHLLTHTAGFYGNEIMGQGPTDEDEANELIAKTLPLLTMSTTLGEYRYATWDFNTIGYIASIVTGKPLSQLFKEYVTDPMGMEATVHDHTAALNAKYPLSQPHSINGGKLVKDALLENNAFIAGSGLYSNADDLCKLGRFFLNGGVSDTGERLLSEETIQSMTSAQANSSETWAYGFGVQVWSIDGRQYYGHRGTYYGKNYRCSLFVDAKTGYSVVILMNSAFTQDDLRNEVPRLIFGMLDQEN